MFGIEGAIAMAYVSVAIGVLIGLVSEIVIGLFGWLTANSSITQAVLFLTSVAAALNGTLAGALLPTVSWVYTAFNWLSALLMTSVTGAIGIVIVALIGLFVQFKIFQFWLEVMKGAVQIFKDFIERKFTEWKENIKRTFDEVMAAIKEKDWEGAGKAFVEGIMRGIENSWGQLLDLVGNLAENAMDAFTGVFNIGGGGSNSASNNGNNGNNNNNGGVSSNATGSHGWRTVPPGFNNDNFNVGLMSGERYMVIPKGGQMSSAMAGSTVNSSRSVQNTMNLNIVSSAPTESIVADFAMMSSMIGA